MPSGYAKGKVVPRAAPVEVVEATEIILPIPKDATPGFLKKRYKELLADRKEARWAEVAKAFATSPGGSAAIAALVGAIAGLTGSEPWAITLKNTEIFGYTDEYQDFRFTFDVSNWLSTFLGTGIGWGTGDRTVHLPWPFGDVTLPGSHSFHIGWPNRFVVDVQVPVGPNGVYAVAPETLARQKLVAFLRLSGAGTGAMFATALASLGGLRGK